MNRIVSGAGLGVAAVLASACEPDCSIETLAEPHLTTRTTDCGYVGAQTNRNEWIRVRRCVQENLLNQRPFIAVTEQQGIEYPIRRGLVGFHDHSTWTVRYYHSTLGTISGENLHSTTAWDCTTIEDLGDDCSGFRELCLACTKGPEVERCSTR